MIPFQNNAVFPTPVPRRLRALIAFAGLVSLGLSTARAQVVVASSDDGSGVSFHDAMDAIQVVEVGVGQIRGGLPGGAEDQMRLFDGPDTGGGGDVSGVFEYEDVLAPPAFPGAIAYRVFEYDLTFDSAQLSLRLQDDGSGQDETISLNTLTNTAPITHLAFWVRASEENGTSVSIDTNYTSGPLTVTNGSAWRIFEVGDANVSGSVGLFWESAYPERSNFNYTVKLLTSEIPEPSTVALLAVAALAGCMLFTRSIRRRPA